ncbi:MAG TPA: DUF167 domain-containing protein [Terriglobia bacterium]|nr:DUF167 domain-containing protein [Terriglobia bacterium]
MSNVTCNADIRVDGDSITFWLRVKPRSSRERLTLHSSGELRLELHAPPTDGQANQACVEFLAHTLRLPRKLISIVVGEKSKRKLICIAPASATEIATRLHDLAAFGQV